MKSYGKQPDTHISSWGDTEKLVYPDAGDTGSMLGNEQNMKGKGIRNSLLPDGKKVCREVHTEPS